MKERDFEKLVSRLNIDAEPDPAHKERLRQQMLATFETVGRSIGPQFMPAPKKTAVSVLLPLTKLALAAAIMVAAIVGMQELVRRGRGPATLNQVCQATQKMAWLHAVVTERRDGVVRTDQQWNDFTSRKAYILTADRTAVVSDFGSGRRELLYSPQVKAVVISDLPSKGLFGADSAYTLIDSFAVFAAKDDVAVTRWTEKYEGKKVLMYELDRTDPGATIAGKRVGRLRIRLMADPETRRLVGAHIEQRGDSGAMLSRQEWVISYPQSGPMSIYDLGVPESTRIIDRTSQATGTPPQDPRSVGTPEDLGRSRLMPLEIALPRPLFIGTPVDVRTPNLERPRRGARPPFLVPLGTTNVALHKPVSSSDSEPLIGTLDMITDGDKEGTDGSIVELGPGIQQVTIDLQGRYEIYAIVVWHYHLRPHVYQDVVVQVSDDPEFSDGVETVFNNDTDDSAGLGRGTDRLYIETNEGKLIDTQGVQGRYVRLYSNGNTAGDLNHYIEVQVYGRPVD
jgi:hypothetical protein